MRRDSEAEFYNADTEEQACHALEAFWPHAHRFGTLGGQRRAEDIRALIRDDKVHQIYSSMQSGKKHGMQTLNDALYQLYVTRTVSADECVRASGDPNEFLRMIGKGPGDEGSPNSASPQQRGGDRPLVGGVRR